MIVKSRAVCYVIFLLTTLDILFTTIGLNLGIIEEANPIMNYLINISLVLSMFFVLLFVGVVLTFLYKASYKVPWLHPALNGLAGIKVYVLMLHLKWISIYLEKR
jgi:hypothetical protein